MDRASLPLDQLRTEIYIIDFATPPSLSVPSPSLSLAPASFKAMEFDGVLSTFIPISKPHSQP